MGGSLASSVVLNGGTLSGTGTVVAITQGATAGTVHPGDNGLGTPGVLNSASGVTLGTGTTFFVDLAHTSAGAPMAGADYDQLNVTGNVNLRRRPTFDAQFGLKAGCAARRSIHHHPGVGHD